MPVVRNCPSCGKPNRIPAKHLADTGRCGACKQPLPADTERNQDLAMRYRVQSIPFFAVFVKGAMHFQQAGLVDANTMKSWLARAA